MNAAAAVRHASESLPGWLRHVAAGALLALVAGLAYWFLYAQYFVSTDDAYVAADISQLSARVTGTIAALPVPENTHITSGTLLVQIDDRDYQLALQMARNKLTSQQAMVAQATAQLAAAQTETSRSGKDIHRYIALVSESAVAPSQVDQFRATYAKARATQDAMAAAVALAQAQLAEAQTAVAQAEQNLAYTRITAPVDGTFGNRSIDLGALVQAGTRVGVIVPDNAYITANFKETQLTRLRTGQPVRIVVDALGGREYTGRVLSLYPAAGSTFSLLPPENATGNFTKIVQRVPVRIAIPAEAHAFLRPGLSVVVKVDTRDLITDQPSPTPR